MRFAPLQCNRVTGCYLVDELPQAGSLGAPPNCDPPQGHHPYPPRIKVPNRMLSQDVEEMGEWWRWTRLVDLANLGKQDTPRRWRRWGTNDHLAFPHLPLGLG
jgi:hypothetical protein